MKEVTVKIFCKKWERRGDSIERRGNFQLLNYDKQQWYSRLNTVAQQNLWSNSYCKTMGRGRFLPALAVSASLSCGEGNVGEGLRAKNSSGPWIGHNIVIDKIKLATVR